MQVDTFAAEMMASFNHLSISDLLAAREQYHVFLMKHSNVVATAIGRYLIRNKKVPTGKRGAKPPRTLSNSHVDPAKSWPCVLVFVDKWQSESDLLAAHSPGAVVPKTLYLPDGRAVPVCMVEAHRDLEPHEDPSPEIRYPKSVIGGGFPLVVDVQGRQRVATVGCVVTDGSKYYAMTNRHVCGEEGRDVCASTGGDLELIGTAASENLQLGKIPFSTLYPGWPGQHLFVNADVGLVDIEDVNRWRTDIFQVGTMAPIADFNVNNLTLSLIGCPIRAFGATSGPIQGQVSALFYRYRSMGGMEYVSDYLIGPVEGQSVVVRRGDSGAVLLMDSPAGPRPFAITWGSHEFVNGPDRSSLGFALATGLGNVCRLLDVDIVRGWNLDQPYTWGKTGHFKIGFRAADLVGDTTLATLLQNNQASLGYPNAALESGDTVAGTFTHDFVPLADVADIIWRTTRPDDESNHFCDIDESDSQVFGGKTLLELSLQDDANIDIDVWLDFNQQMDQLHPIFKVDKKTGEKKLRPREGALPFRVWQMYKQMIKSLSNGKAAEFLVAGGTMAHYGGDACQPLHISALHHGASPAESAVHSDYETNLIDRKSKLLFQGVDAIKKKVKASELIGPDGKDAARLILQLMKATVDRLPPEEVLEVWRTEKGQGKYDRMWTAVGPQTVINIAAGAHTMAILWQSAWKHGNGDALPASALEEIDQGVLQKLYNRKSFVPSYRLSDTAGYKSVL